MSGARSNKIKQTKAKIWNKKFNLGRIAEKFLDHLAEALHEGYVLGRTFSNVRGTFIADWDEYQEEMEWLRKKVEKRRIIYELKKRRLIAEKKIGDKFLYYLTEKGVAELERRKIIGCANLLPKGRFCVVIFDIPESQRHVRELLREFLKAVGFKYLQQSVWITRKDVLKSLSNFIKNIKADHWVNLFLADAVIMRPSKSKRVELTFNK